MRLFPDSRLQDFLQWRKGRMKLIDENEYSLIQKRLMKDYGIVSNITA